MKAAVVQAFDRPPRYSEFEEPRPGPTETLLRVSAAATSRLVRSRAAGLHYSSTLNPPFVAGVDGVGRAPDGRRLYFQFPRAPFGSLAERTVVADDRTVEVPDGIDDATAAAAAIAGMSCWIPLTLLAPIRPGESVLINGATGASGRMAVQVAKRLGARQILATGRDPARLDGLAALGAGVRIPLGGSLEALRDVIRHEAREASVGVVLDYLWGPSAEAILNALGGPNAPRGPSRIRFVQIGQMGGATVALDGALLRSSGVEVLGSGIGSVADADILRGIGEFLQTAAQAQFAVEFDRHALSEIERAWPLEQGRRQVYEIG